MEQNNQTNKVEDELIRQKIMDLLQKNPSIDASKIAVEVNNGEVILKGGIDTAAEKHLSEEIAGTAEGVKSVQNHLHIGLGIAYTLSTLASDIQGDIIKNDEAEKK